MTDGEKSTYISVANSLRLRIKLRQEYCINKVSISCLTKNEWCHDKVYSLDEIDCAGSGSTFIVKIEINDNRGTQRITSETPTIKVYEVTVQTHSGLVKYNYPPF